MKRKIHVIPHSHWDREWYFTTSRSKVYLMKDLGDVLNTLENDPEFKYFMVDAQGSLLDDYIKWRPQDKERISKLVNDGRLVIGPWYTQTDQLVISGESIVRNMYYGMKRCESFGKYMNHFHKTNHLYTLDAVITCVEIKISVSDFHSAHGHNFVGHCNYYAMPTELYKKVKGEIPEDIGVLLYYDGMSTCGIRKAKECKPQILSESTQKWLILSVAKRLPRFDKN